MRPNRQNVQPPDVHYLDTIRDVIRMGLKRLKVRTRILKFDLFRGSAEVSETTLSIEDRDDARH